LKNDVTKDLKFVKKSVIDNIPFTEIHKSNIHGFGLFAKKDFKIDSGKITILGTCGNCRKK